MLINLSNHPSSAWSQNQADSASNYGEVIDLPFPQVDPDGDEDYIIALADEYVKKIFELANGERFAVHVMGELNFTFVIVEKLLMRNISCVASTTERRVVEIAPNRKEVTFEFVRFRAYGK